jgi:ATP-binding cassette subfamily B protein
VITSLFSQLTLVMRAFLSNFMVRNLDFAMMSGFLRHSLSLPISFFAKRKTGDIFARFQENATIRAFLTESTLSTILNLLMVVIYLTILFLYSTMLTSLLLIMVVPILVLTIAATPKLKAYAREVFEASTAAEATLMETISGIETIKGMGIERPIRMKWERQFANALNVSYNAQTFNIVIGFVSQIFNTAISITILLVGARLVMAQELTIGQLMAYSALMGMVLGPLMGLVGLWNQLHGAGVAMERLGDILDMEPEQDPKTLSSRIVLPDLQADIRFEDVYFRYGGSETPYVLENINLTVESGQVVSIVGQSGSGKTTLAKLIVGFYKPNEGRIQVDGYDLDIIDKEYYRAQIGYVMQSNLLFSGTITENIAAGDDNPDRNKIVEVAKLADAHGFISNMPLGYDQVVGERGTGLSGGQMQRLCIARALYNDPKLLILDEATSALDTQSESNIMHNMKEILTGRTAIVIAHRLSTIMNSDKIIVLYQGAIVEEGGHEELVERRGMYYQLVKKQMSAAS